ncbi:MAG: isoaspartyl peptidase/L-asparaginase [Lysobacterales bacterium]|jgi:beta-aspartyl-peptidase (threonine type)|nr:MAG: isoaspartyl peptidase/L-asparaginase [Xanthomonadales bacterium]
MLKLLAIAAMFLSSAEPPIAIAVHGGAGSFAPGVLGPEEEAEARADLRRALDAGWAVLAAGGSALDAAVAAVVVLEDSPHFNAGRGAVYNAAGEHELDAAVMESEQARAGAVAAVKGIRNPVLAARAVMEQSRHVLLVGSGAEAFARRQGIAFADPEWFATERRRRAFEQAREQAASGGTVGAVALDRHGRFAAATSTGGMTYKLPGRVGDAPLIGAGTWAEPGCAVSATGAGEYFIRTAAARTLCLRMNWRGESAEEAARALLAEVSALGGEGGFIVLDRRGDAALPFTTAGMARGYRGPGGEFVRLFADPLEENGAPLHQSR